MAHYFYHVGQIEFIGKIIQNENLKSLPIPKGNSEQYNLEKFTVPQHTAHFTDEVLNQKKPLNKETYANYGKLKNWHFINAKP